MFLALKQSRRRIFGSLHLEFGTRKRIGAQPTQPTSPIFLLWLAGTVKTGPPNRPGQFSCCGWPARPVWDLARPVRADLFPNRFWVHFWYRKLADYDLDLFSTEIIPPPLYILEDHDWLRDPNIQSFFASIAIFTLFFPVSCCSLHLSARSSDVLGGLACQDCNPKQVQEGVWR